MYNLWIVEDMKEFIQKGNGYIIIYNLREEELVKITGILRLKNVSYIVEQMPIDE